MGVSNPTARGGLSVNNFGCLIMVVGASTADIFLSEDGNDSSDCEHPETACRTLQRAMQVAAGGLAVIYLDEAPPDSSSGWLCLEDPVQVRGSITIKPRPPTAMTTAFKTGRLGCGVHSHAPRALAFNVTGTGALSLK